VPRTRSLIGGPSSAGAYAPGQEKAPAAFRRHGIISALTHAGLAVRDRGDLPSVRWRPDPLRPQAMNLDAVRRAASAVADLVGDATAASEAALVLGGDCTLELGTVAGALRGGDSVGLVYIDLAADLNPPEPSDGALDWTGVAHLLDLPDVASELSGLGRRRPMLAASDMLFFAVDHITPVEAQAIGALGLASLGLAEVKRDPAGAAKRAVAWAAKFTRLLVHLDVEVLAFTDVPIAENVRRGDGLTLEELSQVLQGVVATPNWRALTVTEVNPDHAPDEDEAFRRLISLLSATLSGQSANDRGGAARLVGHDNASVATD